MKNAGDLLYRLYKIWEEGKEGILLSKIGHIGSLNREMLDELISRGETVIVGNSVKITEAGINRIENAFR